VHADLQALLHLQEKDKIVMQIEADIEALEPQVQELDRELEAALSELDTAQTRAEEADRRRQELETKIESYRLMQERRRQRLEWVRGAKEASTLMAELDLARAVLAKEEAEWVRSADRVQEAKELVSEHDARVAEIKAAQAPKREEIAAKLAEYDDQLGAAVADRDGVAQDVKTSLHERYERIRQGRAPLALYPLRSGACGHCFTSVPLHRRQKLGTGETLETCEACGVLLYNDSE
jgi:predicted  nucleic acid-binding Zn-ribbon protein